MKTSVGLLVMTRLGDGRLVAVLRRRGKYNPEKDWNEESYPGACQVTAHGKVRDGENPLSALIRELHEELGDDFANIVTQIGMRQVSGERNGVMEVIPNGPLKLIREIRDGDHLITNWGIYVNRSTLCLIRLHPKTGNIEFVNEDDVRFIGLLQVDQKEKGIRSLDSIVMFDNEIDVVLKAFEMFS